MAFHHMVAVWNHNLSEELRKIDCLMHDYPIVSIDTEFPGVFRKVPRDATEDATYEAMKFNVAHTKMIQLGLSLANADGEIGGSWEINFSFMLDYDKYNVESIEFLKKHGINFAKLKTMGIDPVRFGSLFERVIMGHGNLTWVTFHGLYDLGYLIASLGFKPLPDTVGEFGQVIGEVIGDVVDIKVLARLCEGLHGGEVGLEKLSNILNVRRLGGAHQAGSDSLLTALVYGKIMAEFSIGQSQFVGFLYGINVRVSRPVPTYPSGYFPPYPLVCHLPPPPSLSWPPPPPPQLACHMIGHPPVVHYAPVHDPPMIYYAHWTFQSLVI